MYERNEMKFTFRMAVAIFLAMIIAPIIVTAGDNEGAKPIEERNLWRLSWANDAFVRTDNAFTNGWCL